MLSTGGEDLKRVICSEGCGKEFVLMEIVAVPIQNDIEFVGFSCPHCHKAYGHYQNEKITKLQNEQQKLLIRGKRAKGKVLSNIMHAIENKKKEIEAEMDRLKLAWEGGADG